jgi:hypothetical protein
MSGAASSTIPKQTGTRRRAAMDLSLSVAVVLASLICTSALIAVLRPLTGLAFVFALAIFQFSAEGLVPLIVIAIRRERFSDFGFSRRKLRKSIALALLLVVVYDIAMSWHAASWIWIPLRRHNAVRHALAAGLPLGLFGLLIVIVVWGFFEAFFGVFFAKKINQIVGHSGNGWLAPGVLAFAVFNGLLHAAIGQGVAGFVTSFASGYSIAVIPAITGNAWGSSVFQAATNAVGGV